MDGRAERLYSSDTSLYAAVAQWIEYWPPKPRVVGSIPASRATPPGIPQTAQVADGLLAPEHHAFTFSFSALASH